MTEKQTSKYSVAGMQARAYNMATNLYTQAQQIIVVENCFAFMFTNLGDTIARVNGMVIFPSSTPASQLGDSRTVSAHVLDLYKGNITLSFNPGGLNPLVEIVQLFYIG
jgi:hypothetical protein